MKWKNRRLWLKERFCDLVELCIPIIMIIIVIVCSFHFDFGQIVNLERPDSLDFYKLATYYVIQHGNYCVAAFLAIEMLRLFHERNAKRVLNRGNRYHDRTMLEYWLASRVLGYGTCDLIRVPIPTQFKLLLNDTFDNYGVGSDDYYQTPEDDHAKCEMLVSKEVGDVVSDVVNLLIADTYPINIDQIPECVRTYDTLYIMRAGTTQAFVRYYSPELVKRVTEAVRGLPNGTKLNLFATTNPKNTQDIACKVFKLGSRSNISELNIYREEYDAAKNKWLFTKPVKIYHW